MQRFLVAKTRDIPPGGRKRVKAGLLDVTVFNVEGAFHAVKDACPHLGDPLSRGTLEGPILTCPGHGWKFDLRSGRCIKGDENISLRTFETIVEGDVLYVVY